MLVLGLFWRSFMAAVSKRKKSKVGYWVTAAATAGVCVYACVCIAVCIYYVCMCVCLFASVALLR